MISLQFRGRTLPLGPSEGPLLHRLSAFERVYTHFSGEFLRPAATFYFRCHHPRRLGLSAAS